MITATAFEIGSNVKDVEVTSDYVLLRKRNAFVNVMARIFPSEIEKVKNKYLVDSIKEKANKNLASHKVQTEYEVQVLTEVMNTRLVDLKTEARDAVTKKNVCKT
ncbi:MAG TPA: hypothetical protein DCO83_05920 [Mucilaginibacter sp.]|nr:hypothetical protein [Mucilaginibacter sp.]